MSATIGMVGGGCSLASQLAVLELDRHEGQREANEKTIESAKHVQDFKRHEQERAEEEAQHAADDSSFWGDVASVAKVATIAASVAGAAFTGGATLALAAAAVAAGSAYGGKIAKELGASDKVAMGVEIGCAAAGIIAGGAMGSTAALSEFDAAASATCKTVSASATVAGGASSIEQGQLAGESLDAQGNAKTAESGVNKAADQIHEGIEDMQHQAKDKAKTMKMVANLQQSEQELNSALIDAIKNQPVVRMGLAMTISSASFSSSSIGTELAALAMQSEDVEYKAETSKRESARHEREAHEQAEINELHSKASEARTGAIVSGTLQIAGGAMQFASAANQYKTDMDTAQAKQLTSINAESNNVAINQLETRAASERQVAANLTTGSNLFATGSNIYGGLSKANQDDCDTEAAKQRHAAEAAKDKYEDATKARERVQSQFEQKFEMAQEINTANNQMMFYAIGRA